MKKKNDFLIKECDKICPSVCYDGKKEKSTFVCARHANDKYFFLIIKLPSL